MVGNEILSTKCRIKLKRIKTNIIKIKNKDLKTNKIKNKI